MSQRNGKNGAEQETIVKCKNKHLPHFKEDILYHLYLSSTKNSLKEMFGDLKFICLGGTAKRMHNFAAFILEELNIKLATGTTLEDITSNSHRYSMFKAGPVLSVSHGMGMPSITILLHEILKLLHYAECTDVVFLRLGTSGGLGLPSGSLVITEEAVDGLLRPYYEIFILGKSVLRPAKLEGDLARELKSIGEDNFPDYNITIGKTLCTTDFYEGQGRLNGAFCDFNEEDQREYMKKLHLAGVVNIEMESMAFAAFCHHAEIKGAVICVTILDRLKGDQVDAAKAILEDYQKRPQKLASLYIKKKLNYDA